MILTVHIQPNSKQNKLVEWVNKNNLKIKIAAPATEGKANKALLEFLSDQLGIAKSLIQINWGLTGRVKQIEIDLPEDQVHDILKIDN
mgnify:CR=1 FL=1|tara:strand:- start:247 stop:510 length:264 start_codon:yes stop_codon:yes gene_type:complete